MVIAFGVLIYFVFIKDLVTPTNNANTNAATNTANANGGLPNINSVANLNRQTNGNVNGLVNITRPVNTNQVTPDTIAHGGITEATPVIDTKVQAVEPSATGDGLRYYDAFKGKFFILDTNGKATELSDQLFPDAKKIAWSPKDNKAIITFPDNSNIIYDFSTKTQLNLPKEWDNIEFSPTGDKIGFKNLSDDERSRWLAVSNPDGSAVQLIEPIGNEADNVAVNWSPGGQVVALFRDAVNGSSQEVLMIGLQGENFKSLNTSGRGFEGKWSPDGKQLIYSTYGQDTNYNPSLHLVDASGDQVGNNDIALGLQTWVSRCAFSKGKTTVYCAVPNYLPTGSGFYPEAAGNTNDSIYQINTITGEKSILALPTFFSGDRDYSIASVFLSNNEDNLYFTDSTSGQLYGIKLR
jgi:Tol biopolymer transport system component